uniref:Actin n=1 Tax=Globisporangium ultimum (strain ATCC 200006 / CBS 805.95 / DAOM BR144) TaxID=431595 RepID=K3X524_GLOUD
MYAGGGNANVAGGGSGAHAASGGAHAGGTAHHGGSSNAYSNALAEANDLDALVFEYGTSKCKFGYAGEDFPRVYESAAPSAYVAGDLPSERERADAAVANAACMEMDPEQLAQWLFDTSASRLQTRMSDHPLLFVERPFALPEEIVALKAAAGAPSSSVSESEMKESAATSSSSVSTKKQHSKAREQMVEVLMEQLGIPALFCAKSAVLTCYANARTSGLVVEMGATYTSVTSVHEGYAFAYPKSQVQVFGGHDLDAFLRIKLEHQFQSNKTLLLSAPSSPSQEIARRSASVTASCWSYAIEAKESGLCRVADTAFDEAQNAQLPMIQYELPDKTIIAMGTERFSVPEQYFISATSPTGASASESGVASSAPSESVVNDFVDGALKKRGLAVPEWICEVGGMTTEAELRKELFQNIILTGGSSCFENMPLRLEREVVHALSTYQLPLSGASASNGTPFGGNLRVKVIAAHAQERRIGAFLGGSILASLGSFHEMWMSKAEYAEHGAALVHKKCP